MCAVVCYLLLMFPLVACCSLFEVRCLFFVVLLNVAGWSLCVVGWLLSIVVRWLFMLFVVCCSLVCV